MNGVPDTVKTYTLSDSGTVLRELSDGTFVIAQNKNTIAKTVRLTEHEVETLSDIALTEEKPCSRCDGSGCSTCQYSGVERDD